MALKVLIYFDVILTAPCFCSCAYFLVVPGMLYVAVVLGRGVTVKAAQLVPFRGCKTLLCRRLCGRYQTCSKDIRRS